MQTLYERYLPTVWRFAYARAFGERHVAEDVQDKPAGDATSAPNITPTVRYGWKAGKTYAYNFSIESKIGEDKHTSSGRVTYQAVDLEGGTRATTPVEHATGSGFVTTTEGHLVTCSHVVRGATRVDVKFGNNTHEAEVLALDKRNDLALLKIEAPDLAVLPLVDSAAVELAQDVRVVGFPLRMSWDRASK